MSDPLQNKNSSDEVTWSEIFYSIHIFFQYLKPKRIILALFVLVCMIFGFVYAKSLKTIYKAELKFIIQSSTSSSSGNASSSLSAIASTLGLATNPNAGTGGVFEGENLIKYMQSSPILEKTLLAKVIVNGKDSLLINYLIDVSRKNATFFKKSPYTADEKFVGKRDSLNEQQNQFVRKVIDNVKEMLKVEKSKDWNVITATNQSNDPVLPKIFLEQLIREVAVFYSDTKTAKLRQNVKLLESQSDSVQKILYSTMSGIAYNSDNDPNSIRPQTVKLPSQKKQLDKTILESTYMELSNSLVQQRIDLTKEKPIIQIVEKPLLPLDTVRASPIMGAIKFGLAGFILGFLGFLSLYIIKGIRARVRLMTQANKL